MKKLVLTLVLASSTQAIADWDRFVVHDTNRTVSEMRAEMERREYENHMKLAKEDIEELEILTADAVQKSEPSVLLDLKTNRSKSRIDDIRHRFVGSRHSVLAAFLIPTAIGGVAEGIMWNHDQGTRGAYATLGLICGGGIALGAWANNKQVEERDGKVKILETKFDRLHQQIIQIKLAAKGDK